MLTKTKTTTIKFINNIKNRIVCTKLSFDASFGIGMNQLLQEYIYITRNEINISKIESDNIKHKPNSQEFKNANSKSLQTKNYNKKSKNKH